MYQNQFAYYRPAQNIEPITLVLDGKHKLYIGTFQAAASLDFLKYYQVGAVLTVCSEAFLEYKKNDQIIHQYIPCQDHISFDLQACFVQTTKFISEQIKDHNVLVHCYAGKSRSAAVILAYLMKIHKINLSQALTFLKQKRQIINPNPGFILQLLKLEKSLYGHVTSKLTIQQTPYFQVQDEFMYNENRQHKHQLSSPQPIIQSQPFAQTQNFRQSQLLNSVAYQWNKDAKNISRSPFMQKENRNLCEDMTTFSRVYTRPCTTSVSDVRNNYVIYQNSYLRRQN